MFRSFHATSENGNYKSAGLTTDSKMTVNNLTAQKQYFFKVRTLTNTKDAGSYSTYADSEVAYTTTYQCQNLLRQILQILRE